MSSIRFYSITTDIWSSRHQDSFTGVTVHYLDEDYQLQSHVLDVCEFPKSHTAENIRQ